MGLSRLEEIGFKIFSDFIEVSYAFTDLLDGTTIQYYKNKNKLNEKNPRSKFVVYRINPDDLLDENDEIL